MKTIFSRITILAPLFGIGFTSFSQHANIVVNKLHSDSNCSSFEIDVKDSVRLHYHKYHTENLFVKEGVGKMVVGDKQLEIRSGDYLHIPQGTVHGVWVLSEGPLKVISIQSPEFKGMDRHFIDEE